MLKSSPPHPDVLQKYSSRSPTIIKVNVNATPPPTKAPLLPQRSQTPLMQMITPHPEQHIRHRKQLQCHKQVNPTPSHKRKPHNPQNSYQCHCRPTTSKILVNENVRQSLRNNYTWFTGCLSPKNTDPSFLKIVKKLRYQ